MGAKKQGRHAIDRLEEKGVDKGSGQRITLKRGDRAVVNLTNTGTVSKAASVGETPERRGGVHRPNTGFPESPYALHRTHNYHLVNRTEPPKEIKSQ